MTNNVHLVLQGKGGVGKSVLAAIIAQYLISKGKKPLCIDTDPVNATFAGYETLKAKRLDIMNGDEIDTHNFDMLIEMIANESKEDIIIDNGASSFVALSSYLLSNEVPQLLEGMGRKLIINTVITGGQAMEDTVTGFDWLAHQFPDCCTFLVWLNPYWGPVEFNGKTFETLPVYLENRHRVSGFVTIPNMKGETFGRDFSEMLKAKKTFDEAMSDPTTTIMTKQRLKIVKGKLFAALDQLAPVLL